MTEFEQLKIKIGNKDIAAFVDKKPDICYIPENAEYLKHCYSHLDLYKICEKWLSSNTWYSADVQTLTEKLFYNIEWETPEVWLEGLTDEDNE